MKQMGGRFGLIGYYISDVLTTAIIVLMWDSLTACLLEARTARFDRVRGVYSVA